MNNVIIRNANKIKVCQCGIFQRSINELSLHRPKKEKYPLQYKVRVINQDGSSYFIRYHEPIGVIQLPLDASTLTEEQLKARYRKMQSEKKIQIKEYKEDVKFDRKAMAKLMKKK